MTAQLPCVSACHLIAGSDAPAVAPDFQGVEAATGRALPTQFADATDQQVDAAARAAAGAFQRFRHSSPDERAGLLRTLATELEARSPALVAYCDAETALGATRLGGELRRTAYQLRLFADVVEEGSWVEARIDHARPGQGLLPAAPDLRRMRIPVGPVAVFGACNFPFAISVLGNDTVAALAAGCPVVVKAHPGHPGTCRLLAEVASNAIARCGLPPGIFSLLQGRRPETSLILVRHPRIAAVGFTGSRSGGEAIAAAAARRPRPIAVFAELGSNNPLFLLPEALRQRSQEIAAGLAESMSFSWGQLCTQPGLVFAVAGADFNRLATELARRVAQLEPRPMLHAGVAAAYREGVRRWAACASLATLAGDASRRDAEQGTSAVLLRTPLADAQRHGILASEVFGPVTVLVECSSEDQLESAAADIDGTLTATVHGTDADLRRQQRLIDALRGRCGRLVFNGFPTGVAVAHATHHGGPFPATLDGQSTSIGTASIARFARPICFQDCPDALLPPELQETNPRGIHRLVDGRWC